MTAQASWGSCDRCSTLVSETWGERIGDLQWGEPQPLRGLLHTASPRASPDGRAHRNSPHSAAGGRKAQGHAGRHSRTARHRRSGDTQVAVRGQHTRMPCHGREAHGIVSGGRGEGEGAWMRNAAGARGYGGGGGAGRALSRAACAAGELHTCEGSAGRSGGLEGAATRGQEGEGARGR